MSPALQTLTHSSAAEPSATATATPPHQSSFTAGSPPLVLGFLAIALFTAAMVVVFGWRRIQMRGWTIGGISAAEVLSGNVIPVVMKKPKLWDLRNGGQPEQWGQVSSPDPRGPGYAYTDGQWASIMPLSAKAVSMSELCDNPPPSLPAFGSYHLRPSQALQGEPNLFNRFLPRAWRWRSSKPNKNTPSGSPEPSTKLQVGVAIIMPSPEFPLYAQKRTNNDTYKQEIRKRNVITDFSIGIYECTWDES